MTVKSDGRFKAGDEHPGYGKLRPEIVRAKTILIRMLPTYFNARVITKKLPSGSIRYEAQGSRFRDTKGTNKYLGLFKTKAEAETTCRKEKKRLIKALMDYIDIHESGQQNMMSIDEIINPKLI